jgi:PhoH-like ATPase
MRALGSINEGVETEEGGIVRIELNHRDMVPPDLDPDRADNRIISVALGLMSQAEEEQKVTVITKDINLRVKCDALKVRAEDYSTDSVAASADLIYSGITELMVNDDKIDELHKNGYLELPNTFYPNQYIWIKSNINEKHSALARYDQLSDKLVKISTYGDVWGISSRNKEQACALDALFDPNIKLVTLIGKAGCGKTLLATAAGISQLLDHHIYRKMGITRPIEPLGRDIGYLPGGVEEKMDPWMKPIQDQLDLLFSEKGATYLDMQRDEGRIQVEPLTYIRGRSIPKSYIVVDECQNLTRHEVKTIITRIGEDSKLVLTGDILQIDNPYIDSLDNGLSCVVEEFKDEPIAAHVTLRKGERSELATLAAEKL